MEEDASSAWLSLRARRQNSSRAEAELGIQYESFVEKFVKEMMAFIFTSPKDLLVELTDGVMIGIIVGCLTLFLQ